MGLRHAVILATLAVATAGCKRRPPPEPAPPPPPPDRLASGEVPLSKDKAFALALPAGAHVGSRFGGEIRVTTPLTPEELANFVRKRVTGGQITAGATQTRFEGVTVPAEPKRLLRIEVQPGPQHVFMAKSEMAVHDVTPSPELGKAKTEEERWRAAGLTPDGKPLDPNHLE